ncbi:MAG: prepilin-type N-terminal cleavage/methylation domain-containing protein [Verrucomicrobiales bacterium]|nr:prepilin-type N-terminal cleavage/methylation domain-containing protein [Verrucomicrobiales bacterium]
MSPDLPAPPPPGRPQARSSSTTPLPTPALAVTEPVPTRHGFTLLELVVVLAVIGILAGLLIPALARSRLRAKVTVCANHGRQWALAANLYATDDAQGRFPAFRQPFQGRNPTAMLYPWMVNHALVTNLGAYGLEPPVWFCPTRPEAWQRRQEHFRTLSGGRDLSTVADLSLALQAESPNYAVLEYSWWVPRPVEGFERPYPSPGEGISRIPVGWPTRVDDPAVSIQPILSDAFYGIWNEHRQNVEYLGYGSMGHRVSILSRVLNLNVTFADGRVETRPAAKLQWQLNPGNGDATFMY